MTRMHLRQPAFPIIIIFLIGMQIIEPSRVWTILLVGFSGVFITAYLWAWTLSRNFQLLRENNLAWVQVGGQIEENLTLINSSLVPAPWIEFIDQSTLPEFNASKSTGIDAEQLDQWTVNAVCKQRGLFHLGDAKIQTGDPFGIFDVTVHASQRTSILVLPQVATLPEMRIAPAGSFGDGHPRRNAFEQTVSAASVREYSYGDSTRLIHWPTSARTHKVFVRLLESAPEGNWWILLDLDNKAMLGKGWDSIEEQSVALAASLTDKGLRARKSVGLISNSAELTWLTPQKGDVQRWKIMLALALAKPSGLDLEKAIQRIQPFLGKHHSLIIITTSTKLNWLETLLPLAKRGIIPTIILLDTSSFEGGVSTQNIAANLEQYGIQYHIITRGLIELPKTPAQHHTKWTWHSTPNGEIVPYDLWGVKSPKKTR